MNALTTIEQAPKRTEAYRVEDPVPLLDTARFEHMQRVANLLAASSLCPVSLRGDSHDATVANCFLVTNQAFRWGMDPFMVAQCVAVIHGRLCYEGKLVHAVVQHKLGISFACRYDGQGDDLTIIVFNQADPDRYVTGSVGRWATRDKSGKRMEAWVRDPEQMLWYRGVRTWARRYEPAVLMGVYTPDELQDLQEQAKAQRAIPNAVRRAVDVTPPPAAGPAAGPAVHPPRQETLAPEPAPEPDVAPEAKVEETAPAPAAPAPAPAATSIPSATRRPKPEPAPEPAPEPKTEWIDTSGELENAAPAEAPAPDGGAAPPPPAEEDLFPFPGDIPMERENGQSDMQLLIDQFEDDLAVARTMSDLEDCVEPMRFYVDGDGRPQMSDELRDRAVALYQRARDRILKTNSGFGRRR